MDRLKEIMFELGFGAYLAIRLLSLPYIASPVLMFAQADVAHIARMQAQLDQVQERQRALEREVLHEISEVKLELVKISSAVEWGTWMLGALGISGGGLWAQRKIRKPANGGASI